MPTTSSAPRASAELPAYYDASLRHGLGPFTIEAGEHSVALVSADDAQGKIVKFPRTDTYRGRAAGWEAYLLATLQEEASPPPLVIPSLVNFDDTPPYATVLTKVPGAILDQETIRSFSPSEQRRFGKKVGQFVAWLADSISLEGYDCLSPAKFRAPNKLAYIHTLQANNDPLIPQEGETDETLAGVLAEVGYAYIRYRKSGQLAGTIVGHDDLRAENMTFLPDSEGWGLCGVFDFGLCQPSAPERELRHLLPLGDIATEAAITTYEQASGGCIDHDLLRFWAIAQVATATASLIADRDIAGLAPRRADLQVLLPGEDWSGLADDVIQSANYTWRAGRTESYMLPQYIGQKTGGGSLL